MGFVELENAGKTALEQFPALKHAAKRVYQVVSVALSNEKNNAEGNIEKVSPNDGFEYFYGYYDKSPWDATDRYMICIKVKQAYKSVAPKEPGIVGVIDTKKDNNFQQIGTTHSWNVQQSCMAQWMGPDFKTRIIYNDFRNGSYCSVIYNWAEKCEEKVLPLPVYDVARDCIGCAPDMVILTCQKQQKGNYAQIRPAFGRWIFQVGRSKSCLNTQIWLHLNQTKA